MLKNYLNIPSYLTITFGVDGFTMKIVFPIKKETTRYVQKYMHKAYGDNMTIFTNMRNTKVAGVSKSFPYSELSQKLIDSTAISKQRVLNAIHMGYSDYYKSLVK